jgi:3-octaprenyl-4-hydroxybenzoate carboxy-lyase
LEEHGQLVRVNRPVNKDTELHPLVRWQFLGLPERQRKAFLFENIVDSKCYKYASPVLVGGLTSNEEIYAFGMSWPVHRDVRIITGRQTVHSPINLILQHGHAEGYDDEDSALLIDATKKEDFPPVSLPAKEYMENAEKIWKEMELPALNYQSPWHGYSLGYWPKELGEEAQLAAAGEHYRTGIKLAERAIPVEPGERLQDARKRWTP